LAYGKLEHSFSGFAETPHADTPIRFPYAARRFLRSGGDKK
jgi:hypothetical protein